MIACTAPCSHYRLIYNDGTVRAVIKHDNQVTDCKFTMECFNTQAKTDARIAELGLTPLPEEEL